MAEVRFDNVFKRYGDVEVIRGLDLYVEDREFMVLVGPSGCGKSTLLRMLAGLEEISGGEITIDGRVVNDEPPKDRDIAMVFQSYALYPHMTVRQNLEFGLKIRKTPKDRMDELIDEAAEILDIGHLLDRRPRQLSGGQRQRVAVGRAIVRQPAVFLFDEPLSNLDAKLRVQMRAELTRLQQSLETTTIYVTHDQVEAMTMGQRIAILHEGVLQQVGTPLDVYEKPANLFVATFIGTPPMNLIPAELTDGGTAVEGTGLRLPVPERYHELTKDRTGSSVTVGIRPEAVFESARRVDGATSDLTMRVDLVEMLGHEVVVHGSVGEQTIAAKLGPHTTTEIGSDLELAVDLEAVQLFDRETERRLDG